MIPFIAQDKTFSRATILYTIYAIPSRGHVKKVKSQLKQITKGSRSVTKFLQNVKALVDEFALLGAPIVIEDLIDSWPR